ncbi:MAG: CRISPR-associated protein, Csm2 family [Thermotoga sp. 50_1627]|uniref:type III-A CRISPR-associated protein Csm2 n=1 Tax=Pseudothermotoga sp. TaxID=2033661 RepID=UPI00076C7E72|nr:MAG: CRISPR-associated protein, Csm2 family [Thermotoga sp. 50_64]KUK25292.1 MAG: CRISPR-associated protein, Csm2 family [Thermotoga sp. 50_1627]MBC7116975.1 type III-A CRISPR-associated protein Csm2 [Pseudothermotoga sp.]MDK2923005.1 CRISPR-associated protein Csm2 [Pseudothermotoga sp.]HBT39924.1 type III-A CRISPR-associated protein Csm2 [Pseudothermotoga sp.]
MAGKSFVNEQQAGRDKLQENFKSVAKLFNQPTKVDYNELHRLAEEIAKGLKLNSTKIRKFYNFVKKTKTETKTMKQPEQEVDLKKDLNRFIAILMYDAGREKREKDQPMIISFAKGMREVAEKVKNCSNLKEAYDVFVDFFEALVAYHKYYHQNE